MAVSQAELEDREQPGAYHQVAFARDGGDPLVIDTTRPELIPACVALVAHPDDERYQPLLRDRGPHPALRRPRPGQGPPPGRPREGDRHRHDLHVRRHHRRDLVAGAGPARPRRRRPQRPAAGRRPRGLHRRGRRPLHLASWRARRCSARRSASSSCWARPATCGASPARSPTRSSSTRRATSPSRSSPPASGTSATAVGRRTCGRRSSPGAGSSTGTPATCGPGSRTGSRA